MGTTLATLRQRVLIGFPRVDGEAIVAIDRAINDAIHAIATVKDFDELILVDTTNAATVDGQKTYDWISDWGLTRPKKIYDIRLMDENLSRKLTWIPPDELDERLPYVEQLAENRPTHYTQVGAGDFELIVIPDDAYDLYIRYSQWPAELTADTSETPYAYLDTQTVFLAKDIANAYLGGDYFDFTQRAAAYLSGAIKEEERQPDQRLQAQPFTTTQRYYGKGYDDPFVRRDR